MNSKEFIQTRLVSRTNADGSNVEVKNNRYHYYLRFNKSIGIDWLHGQVGKANSELDTDIELWEIHPAEQDWFAIEVRELNRREGIDDSQRGLSEFES